MNEKLKRNKTSFKLGHKTSEEIRNKIIRTIKLRYPNGRPINSGSFKKEQFSNEKHPNWKGDSVKYRALHVWVRSHKPKSMFCEKCGSITNKLDCSSINHTYERDISKWRWLCRKCHREDDKLIAKAGG